MGREHIQNINLLPHGRVSVVYDPVAELAEAAATLAGEARVAASIDELLTFGALDALVIVSPNHLHVAQLRQIVETRPLPILCEKPLFTQPGDAEIIDALFNGYTHPVWVAMEYRYMPPVAALIAQAEVATGGVKMLTVREHRFPFLPKVDNLPGRDQCGGPQGQDRGICARPRAVLAQIAGRCASPASCDQPKGTQRSVCIRSAG